MTRITYVELTESAENTIRQMAKDGRAQLDENDDLIKGHLFFAGHTLETQLS